MPRPPRWSQSDEDHAIQTVQLSSWKYFFDYVRQEMMDYQGWIWRGHRCSNWLLESTFDRVTRNNIVRKKQDLLHVHLERFMYATRGRRGTNPPALKGENDWWALGQHHGLATPLLDWTESPFTAAYFAFSNLGADQTPMRAVYALYRRPVEAISKAFLAGNDPNDGPLDAITFFRPFSDENARLVNQGGLFTRGPLGVDIETWIKRNVRAEEDNLHLIKILIPDRDRNLALRSLNRMNINNLTMFPDLVGASLHCNLNLQIAKY